jgi:hypothetical protein
MTRKALVKGCAFPIGSVRSWKGRKYIKTREGWVPYRAVVHRKLRKQLAALAAKREQP